MLSPDALDPEKEIRMPTVLTTSLQHETDPCPEKCGVHRIVLNHSIPDLLEDVGPPDVRITVILIVIWIVQGRIYVLRREL